MIETTHVYDGSGRLVDVEEVEVPDPEPIPLDVGGQMAALLAAKGVITEDEAADVTGHPKERLVAEVEAWAAAEELAVKR